MENTTRIVTLTHFGRPVTVAVETARYANGNRLAVQLIDAADGSPYATVSVNVEGVALADDEFVFKTYSENEGLLEEMIAAGVVAPTGRMAAIGPICRLMP